MCITGVAAVFLLLAASASAAPRVRPTDDAYKLASALIDSDSLTVMKSGPRKIAKYLGHSRSAGISDNMVVFTTGCTAANAMDPK
jgi:hypothetical protein